MKRLLTYLNFVIFLFHFGCNSGPENKLEELNSIASDYMKQLSSLQKQIESTREKKDGPAFAGLQQQATLIRFNAVNEMNEFLTITGPVDFSFEQSGRKNGYRIKNIKGVSTIWNRSEFPVLLLEAEAVTLDSIKNFPAGDWHLLNSNNDVIGTIRAVFGADEIGTGAGNTIKIYSNLSFEFTDELYLIEIN